MLNHQRYNRDPWYVPSESNPNLPYDPEQRHRLLLDLIRKEVQELKSKLAAEQQEKASIEADYSTMAADLATANEELSSLQKQ